MMMLAVTLAASTCATGKAAALPYSGQRFAKPARSARHEAGGGRALQPLWAASIRDGSAAQPLAGSKGAALWPTRCLQRYSRTVQRYEYRFRSLA